MIHIGFTGTQAGMTPAQFDAVYEVISSKALVDRCVGHHGDCIGADAQFHHILRFIEGCHGTTLHIPNVDNKRAFCEPFGVTRVCVPKPYLERNKDIVTESDFLIACPKEPHMALRSGTWSTYRYAVELKKPRYLVLPNGATLYEES